LASYDNRKFNDHGERAFITTQSIKTLKKYLKAWALDTNGWHAANDERVHDITKLDEEKDRDNTYYKERWINENDLEQKLIVTYSIKYRDYQRQIRNSQIARAVKLINTHPTKLKKSNPNDYKRFITKTNITGDGEIADKAVYSLDTQLIADEEVFDGFYGTCTNLEDEAPAIIAVNHRRWEIEECFRIMKSEFKARPVYLSRDDRIKAHFTTCFLALVIYRFLEKKLNGQFTSHEIIQELRDMNFYEITGDGYVPTYTRTDFTDALHDAFGFRTDYQIVSKSQMKKICAATKK
jgi:transposase